MFWKNLKFNFDYSSEKFDYWETIKSITIERKLQYETAFDGIVKIYSLKSDNSNLNSKLENKYFGDFIYETENGVFMRMFKDKKSWPKTSLIYIDFEKFSFEEIKKTNSSWVVWIGKDLGDNKYSIEITPTEHIIYEIE